MLSSILSSLILFCRYCTTDVFGVWVLNTPNLNYLDQISHHRKQHLLPVLDYLTELNRNKEENTTCHKEIPVEAIPELQEKLQTRKKTNLNRLV